MAVIKKPYELSVWREELKEVGQKEERRIFIIGAHDMTHLGRASAIKLKTKINGTHELSFQLIGKYFDSEKGDFVENPFAAEVYAERKIKLFYKNQWLEFFVKTVKEDKKIRGVLKTYTCQDAFIDELSRNGYGITFDEELYNNVEEIGTFTEEILEDSLWYYEPKNNWGDFTEYIEDKLYKIPVGQFSSLSCYKLSFNTNSPTQIENAFTGETRPLEMGDDQARVEGQFWDQKGGINKLTATSTSMPANDGYIYIPYSCLDFCYYSTSDGKFDIASTEESFAFTDGTYALSPPSVDPNYLIQFYALPAGEEIEIDEAGLILDKDHIYFMTLAQWNSALSSNWYIFKEKEITDIDGVAYSRAKKQIISNPTEKQTAMGNRIAKYEGYLTEWNNSNLIKGKKIQISDRSEINISEEIDQYVTVYNNKASDYSDLYTNPDWDFSSSSDGNYRVCSKIATRQIMPQLARNFAQNGTNIKSTDGWEVMDLLPYNGDASSAKISYEQIYNRNNKNILEEPTVEKGIIYFTPPSYNLIKIWTVNGKTYYEKDGFVTDTVSVVNQDSTTIRYTFTCSNSINTLEKLKKEDGAKKTDNYYSFDTSKDIYLIFPNTDGNKVNTYLNAVENKDSFSFINFGAVGQEKTLEKGKIYCLGLSFISEDNSKARIRIGEGKMVSGNEYELTNGKIIEIPIAKFSYPSYGSPASYFNNFDKDNALVYSDNLLFKTKYLFIRPKITIKNPYIAITSYTRCATDNLELFEVYTKGKDQFSEGEYKYSGRDYILNDNNNLENDNNNKAQISGTSFNKNSIKNKILFEDDVMPGDTYEYQQYYIQRLLTKDKKSYDTMGASEFISSDTVDDGKLPLYGAEYTEDDYEIQTNYIDLNNCSFYKQDATINELDCSCGSNGYNKVCMYQLYGYCPYRFQTEKHCRKIRTLKGEKSNRFNLTQEVSSVFKCYPVYYIEHDEIGRTKYITKDNKEIMDKRIFYITEKGNENLQGFKYHKNLSSITRTIQSDKIVTKLYVQDVDSNISRTGLCSIKTAEDNPSKDSFIIDFSYYTTKGMLDEEEVLQDLYGINNSGSMNGYLKTLGYYNTEYDRLSNQIINLQNSSYTELEANLNVNLDGIETAQKQMRKYAQQISKYSAVGGSNTTAIDNYKIKYAEQEQILNQLVTDTFQTNGAYDTATAGKVISNLIPSNWISNFNLDEDIREGWLKNHTYSNGILGQFNKEYLQIQAWKKERAGYLKKINEISSEFFKKYESYLKEGTWTDSNYLTDNAYYHGALEVAAEGAIPSVKYDIKVIDISPIPGKEDYEINVADTSFIEDEEMFGIDKHSGFPNKFKILISELNEDLDSPSKNSITVQNFTTQFEDLFKQVTATVQSLKYNENIYKRSSNFTSLQNVKESSLQGTLDNNNLTLLSTSENNIQLDAGGQRGSDINNHANQYDLNGQGLQFSNNGGESWNVGVGPSGINADYIKVGTLDAGRVRIADSGYIYFAWDKDGIAAYRDPQADSTNSSNINDYALFNRYGLSLVKNGNIKLRAGYSFNGATGDGDITKETEPGSDIGFYLYDNKGNAIFQTYTEQDNITKLRLRGEIYATDADLDDSDGLIGIYLNNSSRQSGDYKPNRRLFSTVYSPPNKTTVKNVFSVLRNKVLIGGILSGASSVDKLPDELTITNVGIEIDTDGNIYMDFESFRNSQNHNQNLSDYVTNQSYSFQSTQVTDTSWGGYNDPGNFTNYTDASKNYEIKALSDAIDKIFNILDSKYLLTSNQITHN